jgi:hypothetical protein
MKARHAILVALAAAFILASVAAAGPDAAKQRVSITFPAAKASPVSPFVLTPLQAGPIKKDSGTATAVWGPGRDVMREGQKISITEDVDTLKTKRGSLVIRSRTEWVDAGNGYSAGIGTWKVTNGTGQYAGVTGGGRSGGVYIDRGPTYSGQSEGFLTLP